MSSQAWTGFANLSCQSAGRIIGALLSLLQGRLPRSGDVRGAAAHIPCLPSGKLQRSSLALMQSQKVTLLTAFVQAGAGMGIYGPRTVYVIALKDAPGCHEFLLQDDGKWLHVKETTEIGETLTPTCPQEFSVGTCGSCEY